MTRTAPKSGTVLVCIVVGVLNRSSAMELLNQRYRQAPVAVSLRPADGELPGDGANDKLTVSFGVHTLHCIRDQAHHEPKQPRFHSPFLLAVTRMMHII